MDTARLSTARSTPSLSCRVGTAKYVPLRTANVPLRTVVATDTPAGTRSGSSWCKQAAVPRAEADDGRSDAGSLAPSVSPKSTARGLDCRAGQSARLRGTGGSFLGADSPKGSAGLGTPHIMPAAFGGFPLDVNSRVGKP